MAYGPVCPAVATCEFAVQTHQKSLRNVVFGKNRGCHMKHTPLPCFFSKEQDFPRSLKMIYGRLQIEL